MNEQAREGTEFSLSLCRSNYTHLLQESNFREESPQENINKCQELFDTLLTCYFPNQNLDFNYCHEGGDGGSSLKSEREISVQYSQ